MVGTLDGLLLTGRITMAEKAQNKAKYGAGNASITMEENDIVIRVESGRVLHAAGTANKDGKERKRNLVATTSGFATVGACQVSLNVTS